MNLVSNDTLEMKRRTLSKRDEANTILGRQKV
jgi:hypothetical protein